jgi:hypothetical protein
MGAPILAAYILLLPFQALGIPAFGYSVAPADLAILVALSAVILQQAPGRMFLDGEFLRLGAALCGFLAAAAISAVASANPMRGLVAFLPYLHAAGAIVGLGALLTNPAPAVERWIVRSLMVSLMAIALGAMVPSAWSPEWEWWAYDTGGYNAFTKYRFFLGSPNQLSVLVVVYFALLTMFLFRRRGLGTLPEVAIPSLFTNVILLCGSRIAPLSGLILLLAFWSTLVRNALDAPASGRGRRLATALLSVSLVAGVIAVQIDGPRSLTVYRSVSGVRSLVARAAPALGRGNDAVWFERLDASYAVRDNLDAIALVAFRENPVVGTGLAQFNPRYARLEVHNTVLGVAAETGSLGLAALSVLVAYLMIRAVRLGGEGAWGRVAHLGVVLAVFLLHWVHFLLRERWMWLFFLLVAYMAAGAGNAASTEGGAGSERARPGAGA